MSEQRTVRARIAVAVTEHGMWEATGADDANDKQASARARRMFGKANPAKVVFVEADVPVLPSSPPVVIEGVVSPAEED